MLDGTLYCEHCPLQDTLSNPREVDVVLLCADVVAFTKMTERVGDRRSLGIMRRMAKLVRAQAKIYEGLELEIRGDSFLISFSSAHQGVSCAAAIQRSLAAVAATHPEEAVRVRIAVHAGMTVRDGASYFGRNVILPFRVLSITGAGQVAVTSQVSRRLGAGWRPLLRGEQSFRPKGFNADVSVCFVDWYDAAFGQLGCKGPTAGLAA